MSLRGIALLAFIIGSLPFCVRRPFYGLALWSVLAFLNPQRFAWGAASTIPWSNVVAIATLAGLFIFERGWLHRLVKPPVLLILLLWIWFAITSFVSESTPMMAHHSADTWFRFGFVSKILLMTLLTIGLVNSFTRLRLLVLSIAGAFAFFVLKALPFIVLTGGQYRVFGPEHSMIGDNNDFGLAMNMTAPLFFFLARTEPNPYSRRFWGIVFLATIPTIFFTYSRGALVGLSVVMLLMILQLPQRLLIIPVIALGAIIAMLFAPEAWRHRMDPTRDDALDASAKSRINAWTFSWRLAKDFPIAGGGFETFTPQLFDRYAPNSVDVHGPHSIYFGVLAEHGFVGLGLYLSLVATCFFKTSRVIKWAREREYDDFISYANMFRFSLVGFLTSGLFLGRAYFDFYFTIVACILALYFISQETAASTETDVENFEVMGVA